MYSKARLFIFIRNKILKKKKKTDTKKNPREGGGGGLNVGSEGCHDQDRIFHGIFFFIFAHYMYQVLYVHVHIYYSIYKNCYWRGYGGPPPELFLVIFIQNGAILGNSNGYTCLDIMPQQEGRLPVYLIRDVQYKVIYINLIHCICRH